MSLTFFISTYSQNFWPHYCTVNGNNPITLHHIENAPHTSLLGVALVTGYNYMRLHLGWSFYTSVSGIGVRYPCIKCLTMKYNILRWQLLHRLNLEASEGGRSCPPPLTFESWGRGELRRGCATHTAPFTCPPIFSTCSYPSALCRDGADAQYMQHLSTNTPKTY